MFNALFDTAVTLVLAECERCAKELAAAQERADIAETCLRDVHLNLFRGDHGPVGNAQCIIDGIMTARLDRDIADTRADEAERQRDNERERCAKECDKYAEKQMDQAKTCDCAQAFEAGAKFACMSAAARDCAHRIRGGDK